MPRPIISPQSRIQIVVRFSKTFRVAEGSHLGARSVDGGFVPRVPHGDVGQGCGTILFPAISFATNSHVRSRLCASPRVACDVVHLFHVPCPMSHGTRDSGSGRRLKLKDQPHAKAAVKNQQNSNMPEKKAIRHRHGPFSWRISSRQSAIPGSNGGDFQCPKRVSPDAGASVDCFPVHAAFSEMKAGRHPH